MASLPIPSRRIDRWLRWLHLYAGLFLSPFMVVFALSAIYLNHPGMSAKPAEPTRREATIQMPEGLKGLDLAKDVMRQTGVQGEVEFFPPDSAGPRISVPVVTPSHKITINANLSEKKATISERPTTFAERVNYLHKFPGPHLVGFRGNWVFTRMWGIFADGTVYLILFVTLTGIYIWFLVRSERVRGLAFFAAGCICFAAVLFALIR